MKWGEYNRLSHTCHWALTGSRLFSAFFANRLRNQPYWSAFRMALRVENVVHFYLHTTSGTDGFKCHPEHTVNSRAGQNRDQWRICLILVWTRVETTRTQVLLSQAEFCYPIWSIQFTKRVEVSQLSVGAQWNSWYQYRFSASTKWCILCLYKILWSNYSELDVILCILQIDGWK